MQDSSSCGEFQRTSSTFPPEATPGAAPGAAPASAPASAPAPAEESAQGEAEGATDDTHSGVVVPPACPPLALRSLTLRRSRHALRPLALVTPPYPRYTP